MFQGTSKKVKEIYEYLKTNKEQPRQIQILNKNF